MGEWSLGTRPGIETRLYSGIESKVLSHVALPILRTLSFQQAVSEDMAGGSSNRGVADATTVRLPTQEELYDLRYYNQHFCVNS